MTADVDTIVIGGGIVGLAIGRALAEAGAELLVLERHEAIGTEASSRNSEVIHSGIYYPPDSLRAKLCVEGKQMLYDYANARGVPHRRCGKILVATTTAEFPHLKMLKSNGARNGLDDLVELSGHEVRAMEPEVHCVGGLFSPSTGIVDSHALMSALEGDLIEAGGQVVLNTQVDSIGRKDGLFSLSTSENGKPFAVTCRRLVIAAGLESSRLAASMVYPGAYEIPKTYPVKGHYFAYSGHSPFKHLIYPMPSGAWLGVHATLDMGGQLKFGPDNEWVNVPDYSFDEQGGKRLARFEQEIRRYWPNLPDNALHPDYVGIRAKIYPEGAPTADFRIDGPDKHGVPGLTALYGIESPGLTSAMALGAYVEKLVRDNVA